MLTVRFLCVCALLCALFLAASPTFAAPTYYSLTDLGTLTGPSPMVTGVNNSGQVVGFSADSMGYQHAFLYSSGSRTDLGALGGTESYALSLNDSGHVAGTISGTGTMSAFLYSGGGMSALPTWGGINNYATGINSLGQVVGAGSLPGHSDIFHAFLYSGGILTDLASGPQWGIASYATDINTSGQVVGYLLDSSLNWHAFVYNGSTVSDLGIVGGGYQDGYVLRINNTGQVVGCYSSAGDVHGFLYSGGTMTDLGTLGGSTSQALGINGSGAVVGSSMMTDNLNSHAFLYSGTTMTDLNSLLLDAPGWTLSSASDINDFGYICGWGTSPSGESHGYLLTPREGSPTTVPEPSFAALLLLATVPALVIYRKRRQA